jgi:hypothetical protein
MSVTRSYLPSHHTLEYSILAVALILVIAFVVTLVLNIHIKVNYNKRWQDIQRLLVRKTTWKKALVEADKLLDTALKKRHFKGKTMGERLVSAQHELSANDMVWFSHKLTNKVREGEIKLTKIELKKGLLGFWKALKDLGVFENPKEDDE